MTRYLSLTAATCAAALTAGAVSAATLPPVATFETSGTATFTTADGFNATGQLEAMYRHPPLGSRGYIFNAALSFPTGLTVTPNLTITTPQISLPSDPVCLPFVGCFTPPPIVLPSLSFDFDAPIPVMSPWTAFDVTYRSPDIPAGDVLAFDFGTPLFGSALSFGDLVQDQFETGATTLSVSGGIGPFGGTFDYDGTLTGNTILADYSLSLFGPGYLNDLENLVLGLVNDNIDSFASLAIDLLLASDACAGAIQSQVCGLIPGLGIGGSDGLMITVNSIANFSGDYHLDKSISPVPVPLGLPMLAGGLGLLGLMGFRRKRKAA